MMEKQRKEFEARRSKDASKNEARASKDLDNLIQEGKRTAKVKRVDDEQIASTSSDRGSKRARLNIKTGSDAKKQKESASTLASSSKKQGGRVIGRPVYSDDEEEKIDLKELYGERRSSSAEASPKATH